MGDGRTCPTMATCGFRTSPMAGFRIAMATGLMSPTTAGLGLAMSRGDGRRITMGAGSRTGVHGRGGLARSMRGYNPFWSPAYVSFFGWGEGFGFGVGFGGWGGFGWLPIGPCDWFHPWWGGYGGRFGVAGGYRRGWVVMVATAASRRCMAECATRIWRTCMTSHVGRAISTVNAGHFGAGRVIGGGGDAARRSSGARMMAGNLPVVPSRASLSASGRAAAPSTMRNGGCAAFL